MINMKILKDIKILLKEENFRINNTLIEMIKADKGEDILEIGNIDKINFNLEIDSINDGQTEKKEEKEIKEIKDSTNKE